MNIVPSSAGETPIDKVQKYSGMIPDFHFPSVIATSEEDATRIFIGQLREFFKTASDEELSEKLGIVIWNE